ncbi:MAG: hypothetical protein HPY45_13385 [Anaerolineae bacterium]|nr:hypothetical protein [Anaerolineae bacterium]
MEFLCLLPFVIIGLIISYDQEQKKRKAAQAGQMPQSAMTDAQIEIMQLRETVRQQDMLLGFMALDLLDSDCDHNRDG